MSLDGLRVNHAGLDTAAQDIYTAVKDIDDRLNRLENELAPLSSDWTGNAQQLPPGPRPSGTPPSRR